MEKEQNREVLIKQFPKMSVNEFCRKHNVTYKQGKPVGVG